MSTVTCSICFCETSRSEATKCVHCDVWLCKNCVDWGGWFLPICKCPHCEKKVDRIGSPLKGMLKTGTKWYFGLFIILLGVIATIFVFVLDQIPPRKS